MSQPLDTTAGLSDMSTELHWPDVRLWLETNGQHLLEDRALLEQLGLKAEGRNVVDLSLIHISEPTRPY